MKSLLTKFFLLCITVALIYLTGFTYDVGISANVITNGSGDVMLNIAVASMLMVIVTAAYLAVFHIRKKQKKS